MSLYDNDVACIMHDIEEEYYGCNYKFIDLPLLPFIGDDHMLCYETSCIIIENLYAFKLDDTPFEDVKKYVISTLEDKELMGLVSLDNLSNIYNKMQPELLVTHRGRSKVLTKGH